MIKVLFVCHGNICRSAAAEQIMKYLIHQQGHDQAYFIDSAATSTEEIGNPMYPPMREVLKAYDIPTGDHRAVQLTRRDAENYDLIIGFDDENMYYISAICGRENAAKYHRLTEFSGQKHEIDDPWYTRDFETAFREIHAGCEGLIRFGNMNN